jgi:hypothetical protein
MLDYCTGSKIYFLLQFSTASSARATNLLFAEDHGGHAGGVDEAPV